MTLISVRGAAAVVALSLSLGLPLAVPAQEAAPLVAPPPEAPATPEAAWQSISRFGIAFPLPPGAEVIEDRNTATDQEFNVSTMGASRVGIRAGMRRLMPQDLAEFPGEPGSAEYLAYLSDIGRMPIAATDEVMRLGGRDLRVYRGTGTMPGDGGATQDTRMVILIAAEPDAEGTGLLIAMFSAGLGAELSAALELDFLGRLRADEDVARPQDGAAEDEGASDGAATGEAVAAQEAPADDDPFALLEAALTGPAAILPEGWRAVEGFGYALGVPGGEAASVALDERRREFMGHIADPAARTDIGVGMMLADAVGLARLRVTPGAADVPQALERRTRVPVRESERRVMLGGQSMRLYLATGEREETPEAGAAFSGFFLIAETPDADGHTPVIFAAFRGFEPAEAREGLAGVMASLAFGSAEAPVAEAPVVEPPAPPRPAPLVLIDGLASVQPGVGFTVRHYMPNPEATEIYLDGETSQGGPRVRVVGGALTRPVDQQVTRLLAVVQTLDEAELNGLPVWIITGLASRNLRNDEVGAEAGVPAVLVAPRLCVAGQVPYMVALMAAPGQEADLDANLAGLRLQAPEGALACPEAVAAVRAMVPGAATDPAAPEATAVSALPEGWERQERFGLRFALPAGMRVRRERAEPDQMEYWVQRQDAQGEVDLEMSLRVLTPAARAGMEEATPGTPEFAAMLSRFSRLDVVRSDAVVSLDETRLQVYRGSGTRERQGAPVTMRMLYLIAEEPSATGLSPWVALLTIGDDAATAMATEAAFVSHLGGEPVAAEGAPVEAPVAQAPVVTPPVVTPPVSPPAVQTPPVAQAPVAQAPVAQAPVSRPSIAQAPVSQPPVSQPPVTQAPVTQAPTTQAPAASLASPEAQAWARAQRDGSAEAVLGYLAAYPRGLHSGEARRLLRARGIIPPDEQRPAPVAAPSPVAAPAPVVDPDAQAWAEALARGTAQALWTYLKAQPRGAHVGEAFARLSFMPRPEAQAAPAVPQARK